MLILEVGVHSFWKEMRLGSLHHHVFRLCYTDVQFQFLAFWKESLETSVVINSEGTSNNMTYCIVYCLKSFSLSCGKVGPLLN